MSSSCLRPSVALPLQLGRTMNMFIHVLFYFIVLCVCTLPHCNVSGLLALLLLNKEINKTDGCTTGSLINKN